MIDDARIWPLLRAVADGGDWSALLIALEPDLLAIARHQPIGRLRDREDTPREIVTRVIARLHGNDFRAIKKLCAQPEPPALSAWFRVLVRRSAIDYMRETPEFERGSAHREHRWISLASLTSGEQAPAPDSLVEKRRDVIRFVTDAVLRAQAEVRAHGEDAIGRLVAEWKIARSHVRRLIARGPQYIAVLEQIFAGKTYPEVAEALAMTRREVELTVRYLEELMRERGFR